MIQPLATSWRAGQADARRPARLLEREGEIGGEPVAARNDQLGVARLERCAACAGRPGSGRRRRSRAARNRLARSPGSGAVRQALRAAGRTRSWPSDCSVSRPPCSPMLPSAAAYQRQVRRRRIEACHGDRAAQQRARAEADLDLRAARPATASSSPVRAHADAPPARRRSISSDRRSCVPPTVDLGYPGCSARRRCRGVSQSSCSGPDAMRQAKQRDRHGQHGDQHRQQPQQSVGNGTDQARLERIGFGKSAADAVKTQCGTTFPIRHGCVTARRRCGSSASVASRAGRASRRAPDDAQRHRRWPGRPGAHARGAFSATAPISARRRWRSRSCCARSLRRGPDAGDRGR